MTGFSHSWGGRLQGHAASLDLSCEPMRNLKAKIQQIWTDYISEFPPETVSSEMPSATLDSQSPGGPADHDGITTVEVRASNRIENEQEYQLRLAAWGSACETAVNESVEQYIASMIVLIVCDNDGSAIKQGLQRIPFMNEPGRKMFIYDSFCRDPVDWGVIKKHKRSHWVGARVEMKLTQAGTEEGDTLAVLKDMYQTFRTERADHLSEDVVVCLVPGVSGDSPVNETLTTAWKSLKALGDKHLVPKIGIIRVSQDDVLSQLYTRGAWNRSPDHHLLFTYQATPTENQGRKKMKFLKENVRVGDTYFNEWPVPMYQMAQMSKMTTTEHENLFALDTAMDEGAEDGAGAAMVADLGDKVVPFPREFHVKLFQEMIHVWGVESALMLHPGSGQGLLAFVLERKRAVGIMKNKSGCIWQCSLALMSC